MVFLEIFSTSSGSVLSQLLDGFIVLATSATFTYPVVVYVLKKARAKANKLRIEFCTYKSQHDEEFKKYREEQADIIKEMNEKLDNALIDIAYLQGKSTNRNERRSSAV